MRPKSYRREDAASAFTSLAEQKELYDKLWQAQDEGRLAVLSRRIVEKRPDLKDDVEEFLADLQYTEGGFYT